MKIAVTSLGCPKNLVDTEVTLGFLKKAGYEFTSDFQKADILLLNTCAFIKDARDEALENIAELVALKKQDPAKKIVVIGCLPQLEKEKLLQKYPQIDLILGVGQAEKIADFLKKSEKENFFSVLEKPTYLYSHRQPRLLTSFGPDDDDVQRAIPFAYLKIAEGCSHFCSYCLVPRIRGEFRSRPLDSIIKEAQWLAEKGVKEIILVAQDTTAYGEDLYGQSKLGQLLKKLAKIDLLKWLRVLYNYPSKITDELLGVVAGEPKIVKYFDIPFQHVDSIILKNMNRAGSYEKFMNLLEKIRKFIKNAAVRSSFIVGFPGETESQHQLLLEFLTEAKIDRAGFFAYSQEKNTLAGRMKNQIPEALKITRFRQAYRKQSLISKQINAALRGQTLEVLVEGQQRDAYFGRTFRDAPEIDGRIFIASRKKLFPGQMVRAKVTASRTFDLVGEAVN